MNDILKALKITNSSIIPFCQSHFGELLGIFLGCELLDQWFKFIGAQSTAIGMQNIGVLFGRLSVSTLLLVLMTLLIPLRDMQDRGIHGPMGVWQFSLVHLKALTLESLRLLGWVLLFLPLLIIPGMVKYVQYSFVPYVVLCDPQYQAGEVDALKESARLMKGLLALGTFLFILALPTMYFAAQYTEPIRITNEPLKWLLSFALSSGLSFYFSLLLYKLYHVRIESLRQGDLYGSDF